MTRRSKFPWLLLGTIAFVGACTVSSRTNRKRARKLIGFATYCPSPALPSCPDSDREEHDVAGGRYYCFFDCAEHLGELGNWKVTFLRVWNQNLGEFCWQHVETTMVSPCV